jgi:hypothetical protein
MTSLMGLFRTGTSQSCRPNILHCQLTSIPVDPPVAYKTHVFGDTMVKHHKQHQKVASALAFIGATSSDAKTVTACSFEVSFPSDSNRTAVILRVAQNQRIQGKGMSRMFGPTRRVLF